MKLDDILKKAQAMQAQLSERQAALQATTVVGESGAGLVKVTLNGRSEALRVEIDPTLVGDDHSVLEDLIAAAFNDAARRLEAKQKELMSDLTRGIDLPPGMKLPFQ